MILHISVIIYCWAYIFSCPRLIWYESEPRRLVAQDTRQVGLRRLLQGVAVHMRLQMSIVSYFWAYIFSCPRLIWYESEPKRLIAQDARQVGLRRLLQAVHMLLHILTPTSFLAHKLDLHIHVFLCTQVTILL